MNNVLRVVAALAPGKRVTVITAGKTYILPIAPESPRPHPEAERDAEMRDNIASALDRVDEAVNATKAVVGIVAAGQADLAKILSDGVKEIVGTLHLPVVPTKYDKDGRIIEARRKEKT